MRSSIEATLERFRIHFDTWRRQSAIEEHVPEALAAIETYEQEGAVWAPTTQFGDDKDRVVVRSDGTYTYYAADIAYVRDKLERGFDRRSTSSAQTITATSRGCAPRRGCSATTPIASRC